MPSAELTEREMPLIQRGIVDSCFEEGHYEYGIGVLDKLRTNRYRPFPLHIRQLIFIALYPLPSDTPTAGPAPPLSPQKVQLQRHKDDLWPKPASRPLAIALLNAFVNTVSPEVLMRGLPYHAYVDNGGVMDVDPFQDYKPDTNYDDNSPLKDEVLAMQQLKDCWGLLREGLVKRKQGGSRCEADTDFNKNDVIGPYAWPVLEWLISVFERDEVLAQKQDRVPCSGLLLCQIPPPRSKKGPRWDAEIPLRIVFTCFSPNYQISVHSHKRILFQERKFNLGARLMTLLVNLTMTHPPLLSPSHFLRLMAQRLLELSVPSVEALLAMIPLRQVAFKLKLLETFILQGSGASVDNAQPKKTQRTSRARPKHTGEGAAIHDATSTAITLSPQDREKDTYPVSTIGDLLRIFATPLPSLLISDDADTLPALASTVKLAHAKFQLISALLTLELSRGVENMQSHWIVAVCGGRLRESVEAGFTYHDEVIGMDHDGDSEIKGYLRRTLEQVSLWEACTKI